MVSVALGDGGNDVARVLRHRRMVEAIEIAASEVVADPLRVDREQVGILLVKPGRGLRCRRTHQRLDAVPVKQIDSTVEPVEIEPAFLGLDARPGEFRHAHDIEPRLAHHAHIGLPPGFIPGFRVIISSKVKLRRAVELASAQIGVFARHRRHAATGH